MTAARKRRGVVGPGLDPSGVTAASARARKNAERCDACGLRRDERGKGAKVLWTFVHRKTCGACRIVPNDVEAAFRQAREWADMRQPPNSCVTHHGICRRIGPLSIGASRHAQGKNLLLTAYLRHGPRHGYFLRSHHEGSRDAALTEHEAAEIRTAAFAVAPVLEEWNGAGTDGISFVLDARLHPELIAAFERCPTCPVPGLVGNSCIGNSPVFCRCEARAAWFRNLVVPHGWWR